MKRTSETQSDFLTTAEAATALSVGVRTVKRRVNSGDLVAKRDGRRLLIHRWSVSAYLDNLPSARGGAK